MKLRPEEVEDTGEGRDSEDSDEKPPGELSGCYGRRPGKDGLVQDARRERRKEAYERAVVLRGRGLTIIAISQEVGVSERTLHRWFAVGEFPERRPRSDKGPRLPRQYAEHVIRRWREGCRNVSQLHREIREEGYDKSIRTLYVFAAYLRAGQPPPGYDSPPTAKDPDERRRSRRVGRPNTEQISARRGAWSLTLPQEDLGPKEQRWLEQVLDEWSYGPAVRRLAREFVEMVREGKSEKLEDWIGDAECCGVSELKGLAQGLLQDYDAVSAALSMAWSNGQVEGQVHRLKLVKRAMYGRAGFDLLKRRVMEAA